MSSTRRITLAAVIDVVAIVLFVAIGRKNHHEDGSVIGGTLKVAAPFLIALAVGWVAARAWKAPMATSTGFVVWPITVVLGLLLRRTVFDRGIALPFIIVASAFTLLFLVGWRFLAEWLIARRTPNA